MALVHDFRPFALREDHFKPGEKEEKEPKTTWQVKEEAQEQAEVLGNKMRQRKQTNRRTNFS